MIFYGLKLWSSNTKENFVEASALVRDHKVDFIEIKNNPAEALDFTKLSIIKDVPVTVHNADSHGWHEFNLGDEQLAIWQETLKLADFFQSPTIVVHPGQARDLKHFQENVSKIDDPRIIIENMAGLDIYGENVYANSLTLLKELKNLKPICFDFEKAVKAACYQKIDYQAFIADCLQELQPAYFHISGGDKDSPIDEHKNLWEANFDIGWIRTQLISLGRPVQLVFETPKIGADLANDLKNIEFFKQVK